MSLASIATSVPAPMAIPMSAAVRAGASLMPSPTMATISPCSCRRRISWALSPGKTSARTWSIPRLRPTASAGPDVVPRDHGDLEPHPLQVGDGLFGRFPGHVGQARSARATVSSCATKTQVFPVLARRSPSASSPFMRSPSFHESQIPSRQYFSVHDRPGAEAGNGLETFHARGHDPSPRALSTMARARGCSETASMDSGQSAGPLLRSVPAAVTISVTSGSPLVRVPGLVEDHGGES